MQTPKSPNRPFLSIHRLGAHRRNRSTPTNDSSEALADSSQGTKVGSGTRSAVRRFLKLSTHEQNKLTPTSNTPNTTSSAPSSPNVIPFSSSKVAFAVDVSTSTTGVILEAEREFVRTICAKLIHQSQYQNSVLPWSSVAHPVLDPSQLEWLQPSYGTMPTAIMRDEKFSKVLERSGLWFLLTDGYIDQDTLRSFANDVGTAGLHGTASVIIIFGQKPHKPSWCNISVGSAVFAIAPDCLFLYYDVWYKEFYMLQCKGCFRKLLPMGMREIELSEDTAWYELPQLDISELTTIMIPTARKLGANDIALASRNIVNLDDLYQGRLNEEATREILSNDDNLKSVLLTSETRGRREEVEKWVKQQKKPQFDPATAPRPDVKQAFELVRSIVVAQSSAKNTSKEVFQYQALLRQAHAENWRAFALAVDTKNRDVARREVVVHDALDRIHMAQASPASPMVMSPVSPVPADMHPQAGYALGQHAVGYRPTSLSPYQQPPQPPVSDLTHLLYTPGYEIDKANAGYYHQTQACPICNESKRVLALLLRTPPPKQTEDLPQPDSRFSHPYPLMVAGYPETDIISSFVCCEACSYFVVKHGTAPNGDSITGAIPLVPFGKASNTQTVATTVQKALSYRFDLSGIDQVFLAILCDTMQHLSTESPEYTDIFYGALQCARREVAEVATVPMNLSTDLQESESHKIFTRPLWKEMQDLLRTFDSDSNSPLLNYPIEGFIVLLHSVQSLRTFEYVGAELEALLFCRFAFYFTEQYFDLIANTSKEEATIRIKEAIEQMQKENAPTPDTDTTMSGTKPEGLVSENTMHALEGLGAPWKSMRKRYSKALELHLQFIMDHSAEYSTATECYNISKWRLERQGVCVSLFPPSHGGIKGVEMWGENKKKLDNYEIMDQIH